MTVKSSVLLFLLFLPVRGEDGCPASLWKCGDICQRHGSQCECGGKDLYYSEEMWCCHTERCKKEKKIPNSRFLYVSCEGAAVSLTEPCQGGKHHRKCPKETGITRSHELISACNTEETKENISISQTTQTVPKARITKITEGPIQTGTRQNEGTTTIYPRGPSLKVDNLTIVSLVAGALFVVIIAACCGLKLYKSRKRSHSVAKEDFNPIYGDYSDIYQPTEIYDRNPDYSAVDLEETGATIIRDNNPDYE